MSFLRTLPFCCTYWELFWIENLIIFIILSNFVRAFWVDIFYIFIMKSCKNSYIFLIVILKFIQFRQYKTLFTYIIGNTISPLYQILFFPLLNSLLQVCGSLAYFVILYIRPFPHSLLEVCVVISLKLLFSTKKFYFGFFVLALRFIKPSPA